MTYSPVRDVIKHGLPRTKSREVNIYRARNFLNVWRGLWRVLVAKFFGVPTFVGVVHASVKRSDGTVLNLGLISMRVVTTAGVNFIVDAFQNSVELENQKYHGYGTGTNAEAAGDTALQTELTTQYQTNNTRPTGTTTEGASANIYRTVATVTPDASVAITEHGVLDQASNAGGTLLDRSVFSAINLNGTGDSLQTTYDLTFTAGS
jgi:hypothetical protein